MNLKKFVARTQGNDEPFCPWQTLAAGLAILISKPYEVHTPQFSRTEQQRGSSFLNASGSGRRDTTERRCTGEGCL